MKEILDSPYFRRGDEHLPISEAIRRQITREFGHIAVVGSHLPSFTLHVSNEEMEQMQAEWQPILDQMVADHKAEITP